MAGLVFMEDELVTSDGGQHSREVDQQSKQDPEERDPLQGLIARLRKPPQRGHQQEAQQERVQQDGLHHEHMQGAPVDHIADERYDEQGAGCDQPPLPGGPQRTDEIEHQQSLQLPEKIVWNVVVEDEIIGDAAIHLR